MTKLNKLTIKEANEVLKSYQRWSKSKELNRGKVNLIMHDLRCLNFRMKLLFCKWLSGK
jgi:hypothetical protein